MFEAGADAMSINLLSSQLEAARTRAMSTGKHHGVHIQMIDNTVVGNEALAGMQASTVITQGTTTVAFTQAGGYQSTAISPRAGQVALAGGTATVTSPWAFPQSLIYLTVVGPSAAMGTPFVSARAAGSFTVQSTSATDASTVAWMIM